MIFLLYYATCKSHCLNLQCKCIEKPPKGLKLVLLKLINNEYKKKQALIKYLTGYILIQKLKFCFHRFKFLPVLLFT